MENNKTIKDPKFSSEIYQLTEARLRYMQILRDKVDSLEIEYNNLEDEADKSALLMNFINGDSEIYTLSQLDTGKVPASVVGVGVLSLSDAVNIVFASMKDVDVVSVLSSLICDDDFCYDNDNGVYDEHVLDSKIIGSSAMRIKRLFDICSWYCVSNNFKNAVNEGNIERIKCGLIELYLYNTI